ncbi:pyridoxal phosphate-dependent aminotransferase [Nostoc sphaeroides]|uniref:Aspartate/tyrosine/aromatic aminotransferase n=1 Tax=Nostoc sphaeroides CCNUC1 TaxID=2653204 RepID=A0A5P8W3T2_9NOSO|nr:pyridoxal phosphate-dependent aminotransferase [Nostoc sphaeroides]QFS47274.1 aspartate/tyrosine/aromatic aminotransferase [Nostoc sphaeroides CCNUC1]
MNILNLTDLTQHEAEAIDQEFNFANAFNQQTQSSSQMDIITKLPEIWLDAKRTKQKDSNEKFIVTFYTTRGLNSALQPNNIMLHYAASIAIIHIANYLVKKRLSVSLIEPCFDSLFNVFKHLEVPIYPLKEELLHDGDSIYENLKKYIKTDAIFLVDPNNPTGFTTLGIKNQKIFAEIVRFCKDYNKLLIIDYCFANFLMYDDEVELYDTYQVLKESGINYMAIEDTGKYWPIQNTKVAMLKVSDCLYEEMYSIYTAYILSISPFILNLLSEYILESHRSQFSSTRYLLKKNQTILKEMLQGTILHLPETMTKTCVAWCEIQDSSIKSTELQEFLFQAKGVYILPGTFFYWSNHPQGEKYIRIALARDTDNFMQGMKLLKEGLEILKLEKSVWKTEELLLNSTKSPI